ncbi:predicted protein [Nematostella vectensis]|uniref:FGF n=1 Tax=Nematostella vectensis TaxID=45351 RepID=A7S7P8_NEMVE|nr:predicted protein [Nematostella vectensis]|eukprot:XP_001632297.1 predicted protein [Nematostella vectensis]
MIALVRTFLVLGAWSSICVANPMTGSPHATRALQNLGIDPQSMAMGSGISVPKIAFLYSSNSGKFVRIHSAHADGAGNRQENKAKLIIESTAFGGQVRVRSFHDNKYLCITRHGDISIEPSKPDTQGTIIKTLFSRPVFLGLYELVVLKIDESVLGRSLDRCAFIQKQQKGFTVFISKIHKTWALGVRNDGRIKPARKTTSTQRAAHFLEL